MLLCLININNIVKLNIKNNIALIINSCSRCLYFTAIVLRSSNGCKSFFIELLRNFPCNCQYTSEYMGIRAKYAM